MILNSLLYKLPDYQIYKLQLIQNNTARMIKGLRKHHHITPTLKELHWLPVPERIQYKIILLVFKCVHNQAPSYLMEMICPYQPTRALRSSSHLLLEARKTSKKYGERAFSVCGPKLWNSLPLHIRQKETVETFKVALKTYLFRRVYNVI